MTFDPNKDTVAVTIPRIRLLVNAEGVLENNTRRENELYFVSVAIDESGAKQKQIDFGHSYWPAIRRYEEVQMTGDGSLVYGPKNPGSFVAYSILVLESDADMRERGARAKEILGLAGKVFDLASVLPAIKAGATALSIVNSVGDYIAKRLAENKDDELMRIEGVHFRDSVVPYNVNRRFTHKNKWLHVEDQVTPLPRNNGQGMAPQAVQF